MEYFFNFEKLAYVKGAKPQGCILCLIRDGSDQVVDLTVFRTERFIVSVNLYPYNPGHLMVFPVRHIEDIREYTAAEERELQSVTRHILGLLDRTHSPAGYNLGYNMHGVAGASIEHLHMHIIPRYPKEIGIADIIAGKRVLVENPQDTASRLQEAYSEAPFSNSST